MLIGAHVSASGGAEKAPERARDIGADVMQIFLSSPHTWASKDYSREEAEEFKAQTDKHSIQAAFAHEKYLTNFATPKDDHRQKSIKTYKHSLKTADQLGLVGVVVHLGSHLGEGLDYGIERVADGVLQSLEDSEVSYALLENSAGSGNNVGRTFEELAKIYQATGRHPRIKFCLDTQHLFGGGYDVRTKAGVNEVLDEFDQKIGLENLVVCHFNDSKVEFDSHKDRHENIGDGHIGNECFETLVNHSALEDIPAILEVPGIDDGGPDAENIQRLRKLVK